MIQFGNCWRQHGYTRGLTDPSLRMGILDSTRTIPRVPPSCVAFGDLLVLCLAIPSIFLIMRSNKHGDPADESYPWENTDILSIAVTYALWQVTTRYSV